MGRDVGVEDLSVYVQSVDSAPPTCLQVQSFGGRSAWFRNIWKGGVNGQIGRIIEQVVDCFTVARPTGAARYERTLKALGDFGG